MKASRFVHGSFLLLMILPTVLGSLLCMTPVQANESTINIVDTWVEDGFLFQVAFEAEPTNSHCQMDGEGLIEFEVAYDAQTSGSVESVFGVATWYPSSDSEIRIATQGQAIGSQALCTRFSPCEIQAVHIVETWCPVTNGPLYEW